MFADEFGTFSCLMTRMHILLDKLIEQWLHVQWGLRILHCRSIISRIHVYIVVDAMRRIGNTAK